MVRACKQMLFHKNDGFYSQWPQNETFGHGPLRHEGHDDKKNCLLLHLSWVWSVALNLVMCLISADS